MKTVLMLRTAGVLFVVATTGLTSFNVLISIYKSPFQHKDYGGSLVDADFDAEVRPVDDFGETMMISDPPIDAVITWVNGADPEFQKSMKMYVKNGTNPAAISSGRFQDHDDLRFLLRSLDLYGKIFRNVFLVLASPSQVPKWLSLRNPRLKIVYHSQLWLNQSHLPTFNSMAIEVNLHHIDGLAELFVYFNDDIFLVNHVTSEDFIWQLKKPLRRTIALQFRADKLTNNINLAKLGNDVHWLGPAAITINLTNPICAKLKSPPPRALGMLPRHTPHLLIRSLLYELERDQRFAEHFKLTSSSRTRFSCGADLNVVMLFYTFAECAKKINIVIGDPVDGAYYGVDHGSGIKKYVEKMHNLTELYMQGIKDGTRKFVCLNDHTNTKAPTKSGKAGAAYVYAWRRQMLPDKCMFES